MRRKIGRARASTSLGKVPFIIGSGFGDKVMDSRYADEIVKVAKAEAQPGPYGKVNDFQRIYSPNGHPTEERYGWQRLKEDFEVAAKFTGKHWKNPG